MSDFGSDSNGIDMENLESDLPQSSPKAPWSQWTEEEKEMINQHFNYFNNMLVLVNQIWESGPSKNRLPKKPSCEITQFLEIGAGHKKKKKSDSISDMTGEEFHLYLSAKLDPVITTETTCKLPSNLIDMPEYLDESYIKLRSIEAAALKIHLELGKRLNFAKGKFDAEKRKKRQIITFGMWIQENTKIKEACARRHREIALLTEEYPKLENLNMSYTEFLKIKNKIKEVFQEDKEIGRKWK